MNYVKYIKNPFISFGILNVVYAIFIPLNILPGAPHDDTLFYQLGYNIGHLRWLGDYSTVSHIKGPVYPFFIAISVLLHIPLRALEAIFTILTSYYFISFIKKLNINCNLLIITYVLLIFYPYQYGLIDFRILRDMIYPQICLMIFAALGNIYFSIKKYNRIRKKDTVIFGVFLFLILNTREESIWIAPSLLLAIIFLAIFLRSNFFLLIKSLMISGLILIGLTSTLSLINYAKYGSLTNNIFKNSDFQSGYGALYRVDRNKLLLESVNQEDFDKLFIASPSLEKLKFFLNSDQYRGWIETACFAHQSQGKNIGIDTSCPKNMPAAFLLFALMDGMWSIGLKSPSQMTNYMKNVAEEINTACIRKILDCVPATMNNMPPQLINSDFKFSSLLNKIKQSIDIIMFYSPPTLKSVDVPQDADGIWKIRRKLHAFVFPIKEVKINSSSFDEEKIKKANSNAGWVDGIFQRSYGFDLVGWAYDGKNKFDEIVVISGNKKICSTKPNVIRRDINLESPNFIGFLCKVNYEITSEPIKLEVYGYKEEMNVYSEIQIIDFVEATLSNVYDGKCYTKYNTDVSIAEQKGLTTGYEHWKKLGVAEKRKCSPLEIKSREYLDQQKKYSISENIAYEYIAKIYHIFISNLWFLIPIALIIMLLTNQLGSVFISMVLISLIAARVLLISALDVVGMAPVSGMYLASGVYLYFILFLFCVMSVINILLIKIKLHKNLSI